MSMREFNIWKNELSTLLFGAKAAKTRWSFPRLLTTLCHIFITGKWITALSGGSGMNNLCGSTAGRREDTTLGGSHHDRDVNAAINLRNYAIQNA